MYSVTYIKSTGISETLFFRSKNNAFTHFKEKINSLTPTNNFEQYLQNDGSYFYEDDNNIIITLEVIKFEDSHTDELVMKEIKILDNIKEQLKNILKLLEDCKE